MELHSYEPSSKSPPSLPHARARLLLRHQSKSSPCDSFLSHGIPIDLGGGRRMRVISFKLSPKRVSKNGSRNSGGKMQSMNDSTPALVSRALADSGGPVFRALPRRIRDPSRSSLLVLRVGNSVVRARAWFLVQACEDDSS